jgi:hypothetical protein
MRSVHVGLMLGLSLLTGCSGKKQEPLPDQVDFEIKVTGVEAKKYVLNFKPLDEDIAKRSKHTPSGIYDEKSGVFKGKAIPGQYEVSAQPIPQGAQGGAEGPGAHSIGATNKATPLGKVTISQDSTKPITLNFPH